MDLLLKPVPMLFLASFCVSAEPVASFSWVAGFGGASGNDQGLHIAVDGTGSVLVTGSLEGNVSFGATNLVSRTNQFGFSLTEGFIAKYDSAGSLLWVRSVPGPCVGITTDMAANVYVTGYFWDTIAFGSTNLTSRGQADVFVYKCNANGEFLWVVQGGGPAVDYGLGVGTDLAGNAYVTGVFAGTASFGTSNLVSNIGEEFFIAKYADTGQFLWARQAIGDGDERGNGVAVDGTGNAYVTGYFTSTMDFGGTNLATTGIHDIFVAKYDAAGGFLWARQAGSGGDDRGHGIAVDPQGNPCLTGYIQGDTAFGAATLTNRGIYDVFVAKYDSAGGVLWARSAGGSSYDAGQAVAVDSVGQVYVTGYFGGNATFGTTNFGSAADDIFVAKYDRDGSFLWAQRASGNAAEFGEGIAVDAAGNVYLTGAFQGTVVFGATNVSSSGGYDGFVATLGTTTPPLTIARSGTDVLLSWSALALGFFLEATDAVDVSFLTNGVPAPSVVAGSTNTVTIPIAGAQRFFRLKKP